LIVRFPRAICTYRSITSGKIVTVDGGFVVCLVGFPGSGKLTIARALAELTGAKVVDNHWINDPILKLVTEDGSAPVHEAVWPQGAKVRAALLETIAIVSHREDSYIFTYAGSDEDPEDRGAFEDYRDVAVRRGSPFFAVRLLCDEAELVRRIRSAERQGPKLVDPDEAIQNVRNFTPLDPRCPDAFTLDVTNLPASEAANAIVGRFKLIRRPAR
jgi:hypothetical protein